MKNIDLNRIPNHIAIIMDGNGRWAEEHGKERIYGHQNGVEAVRSAIEGAGEIGVKFLTLYAFSTENWNRPKEEIDALMALLVKAIKNELDGLMQNKVRLQAIGNLSSLPVECQSELQDAIEKTKNNTGLTVVLALSYSGRWEIVNAVKEIIKNNIEVKEITESNFSTFLNTTHIPDPDILIRTGRECRISNFLLWQIAYAELFFPAILWPDFRKEHLFEIIVEYQTRQRRFGKTGAQISNTSIFNF
ncbi:MAG: isoprenyl transferase [Bacteroidetes bacterium]|nr:isoprenyl transferase [Bacteroidota bacterium]MCL2302459.1 isoprenyl transferase [Lentimicrobiaceae bacterium]